MQNKQLSDSHVLDLARIDGSAGAEFVELARPRLLGIAYRILGSHAEAEDAVQDTFIRWHATDRATIQSPGAWLTAVCARRAVDMLRASYRSRVDYIGSWLPEPIHTTTEHEADAQMDLSSSLSTAFLLMLERLVPKERTAYLLYEICDMSYADIAASLDTNEAACRKLVSRAKSHIAKDEARYQPTRERQEELLAAFQDAVRSGRPDSLVHLLVRDVRLTADGGGKVVTVTDVLHADEVLTFLAQRLNEWWRSYEWSFSELNGAMGVILREAGKIVATVSFSYASSGRVTDIFIMRNPDKLAHLDKMKIHSLKSAAPKDDAS